MIIKWGTNKDMGCLLLCKVEFVFLFFRVCFCIWSICAVHLSKRKKITNNRCYEERKTGLKKLNNTAIGDIVKFFLSVNIIHVKGILYMYSINSD